jgi:BASS family bile acid:Na+ symporter
MAASPGTGASLDLVQLLQLAFQMSTILTVFGFGLAASVEDVLYLVRHPRMLLISLVSMFIVMPFVALGLAWVFDPPQVARVALVALALSPVPAVLPAKVRGAAGRASYGLGLMATISILSIVLVPALVEFLGALMGRPFQLGPSAVAGQVLVAVVLPLAAGMLVRAFLPRLAHRVEEPAARVAKVLLAAATVLLLVAAFPQLLAALTVPHRCGYCRLHGAGAGVRSRPGRTGPRRFGGACPLKRAPASGHRPGHRAGNFPSPDFGAVIILYLLTAAIVCAPQHEANV